MFGPDGSEGYAQTIENVERVVFLQSELTEKGITPQRGHTITLTEYNITVQLEIQEPREGPVRVSWLVSKV